MLNFTLKTTITNSTGGATSTLMPTGSILKDRAGRDEIVDNENSITIRFVKDQEELKLALSWAKAEGWNPGTFDHQSYFDADKQGFLFLFVDEKPVGCISLVKYQKDFAFIGLFIVIPAERNKGYGKILWNKALELLNEFPTVGLYAVPQQISRYKAANFNSSFNNQRWQTEKNDLPPKQIDSRELGQIQISEFSKLFKYDKAIVGIDRKKFLKALLNQTGTYALISFDETRVNGYCMVRSLQVGFRISLYANDFASAKKLTKDVLAWIPSNHKLIFDIPQQNPFSVAFAEFFHLNHVEAVDTQAMFKGQEPSNFIEGNNKCYGLPSLELG